MLETIEVIYIGNKFYDQSGTAMSCIYKVVGDSYDRYDWGFMQRDLSQGFSVEIRPATDAEFGRFQRQLDEIIQKRETDRLKSEM